MAVDLAGWLLTGGVWRGMNVAWQRGRAGVVKVEMVAGVALAAVVPELARLRIEIFRAWPYLYDGSEEYEAAYLQTYVKARGAAVAVARAGGEVVGASTCLPMGEAQEEVQACFSAAGMAPDAWLYFGESVLRAKFRGQGVGVRFFELREAHARGLGLGHCAFCAVERPAGHPMRPPGDVGLAAFWARRGYQRRPELVCEMRWRDIGEAAESAKPLVFWTKSL